MLFVVGSGGIAARGASNVTEIVCFGEDIIEWW